MRDKEAGDGGGGDAGEGVGERWPTVTAGLTKDLDEVNQYAAPMYATTEAGVTGARPAAGEGEGQQDQAGGGDDLAEPEAPGGAVLAGEVDPAS